ncbi:MAG: Subtilase family protein [Elusimicrobia bacterium ADurb.Bin231]|nr:MAG: Subtilase family protein [Elusimicrobia bacterium ADurb.Bin231]
MWCKTKVQHLKDSYFYLNFYAKYDFENDSDFLCALCSEDASSWEVYDFLTDTSSGFEKKEINVTSVMEYFKSAYFGFGIYSDDNVQAEGAIIDDFSIDRYGLALDKLTYEYYDGTSMAAPCVAGLAALMLSVKPDLSVSTLKSRILASVDKKANLLDRVLTGGRINAYNALDKIVNNNSPTLGWVGVSNYVTDGIHPNAGGIITPFSYRVKYSDSDNDNPKSGYPLLHVLKAGAEIPGSPFQMKDTAISDADYSDGKIYEYSLTLSSGTDYSYFFEAYDVLGATASGTGISLGPDVGLVGVVPGQAKILGGAKGYVNPIHGEEAKIIFFSPTSGTVNIKIYTLNGQLVWEKKELVLPDQQNTVAWACRNIDGNVVASGIYLVHIKGAGMDIKKKIAILK